jgi:hypothetical protein
MRAHTAIKSSGDYIMWTTEEYMDELRKAGMPLSDAELNGSPLSAAERTLINTKCMTPDEFQAMALKRDFAAYSLVGCISVLVKLGALDNADIAQTNRQAISDCLIELDHYGNLLIDDIRKGIYAKS